MWIQDPAKLMAIEDETLFGEGRMHWQKSRMEFALANVRAIPSDDAVAPAVGYVLEACGIALTAQQLLAILSVFPIERAKFAEYGWGDTEIRELTLEVLAHFFLSSRWPLDGDEVDVAQFIARLQKAAAFMGYGMVA
jgi:hypothetical protein